jgi:hypothetical protein
MIIEYNDCYFTETFHSFMWDFTFYRYVRERPFNLKGGGGFGFFFLIPNVAEKNILILVEEKQNYLIQSFCHIT